MLGAGGVGEKTYIDQLFASNTYKGNGASSRTITTGIDISTEGGMTWLRDRGGNVSQMVFDTARGARKRLRPSGENSETDPGAGNGHTGWTTTGFTLGTNNNTENWSNYEYINWNFRKAKGFFDVVTYTGNGTTGQYISHNLGCVPGVIMIKSRSATTGWVVYHVSSEIADEHAQGHGSDDYEVYLHSNGTASQSTQWMSTTAAPTATNFHLNKDSWLNNKNGETYVAYVFAAGRSTAATARCTQFDGSNDQLNIPDSTDWDLGDGDFTLETWIKSSQNTATYKTALGQWTEHTSPDYGWAIRYSSIDVGNEWSFFYSTNGSNYVTTLGGNVGDGAWHHIAVTRTGGNLRTFTDGVLNTTRSTTDTFNTSGATMKIGGQGSSGNYFGGQLSNVRLVKGTALYTANFTPPTEPLTNVTNTKLLCCNNLSVTGSTVTPGTITKSSSPRSIPESPFKDSAAEKFGEAKESVIHCGSYIGGGGTYQNIDVGWEPQWLLIKDLTTASNWILYDSLRGFTGKDIADKTLYTNSDVAEVSDTYFNIKPWGFKIESSDNEVNKSNGRFIFIAIRRPDGYVGKPATVGTDVFTIDASNGSTTPAFDSGFPVDFALIKNKSTTSNFWAVARQTNGKGLYTNAGVSEQNHSELGEFDHSTAHGNVDWWDNTNVISWMWKRGAGFDVVTYRCNENIDSGIQMIPHTMNSVPEMYWVKNRSTTSKDWAVYHKGLNGGTNPHNYYLTLNTEGSEGSDSTYFGAAPTKTAFAVNRSNTLTGHHDHKFIAMLFSSVEGISKVGYYSGNNSGQTITTGFQPRFIILRSSSSGNSWMVFDTVRGWAQNTQDWYLRLDWNSAQSDHVNDRPDDVGHPLSTGFYLKGDTSGNDYITTNKTGVNYIYYAHA